jgi:hypothetical protein
MYKQLAIIVLVVSVVLIATLVPVKSHAFLGPIWVPNSGGHWVGHRGGCYSECSYSGYYGGYGYPAYTGYNTGYTSGGFGLGGLFNGLGFGGGVPFFGGGSGY